MIVKNIFTLTGVFFKAFFKSDYDLLDVLNVQLKIMKCVDIQNISAFSVFS